MIYTLGESLVDMIFETSNVAVAKAGGGMLNTSVSISRCGIHVSLISEVGDDQTASLILNFLDNNNVGIKYIKKYFHQNTSVALAFLNEQKVASFSIYKSYPVHRRLVCPAEFSKKDIMVFGSLYALDPAIRNEIKPILISIKQAGGLVCYDPNIRKHNLDDDKLQSALEENIAMADIIKASDEDMNNIFGELDEDGYYEEIRKMNPHATFILTLGKEGVVGYSRGEKLKLPAIQINPTSTIGAGDAYNAGIVFYLEKNGYSRSNTGDISFPSFKELLQTGIEFSTEVCGTMENYVRKGFR